MRKKFLVQQLHALELIWSYLFHLKITYIQTGSAFMIAQNSPARAARHASPS